MNARTGELSLDGAWGIDVNVPSNPGVAMCNAYNGAALPSKAWADSLGRPVLLGFESAVDRAFSGAQGAASDSPFSADVYDRWGYPFECGSWFCAHDGNSTPSWALANITDYGDRYCTIQLERGRHGPLTPYGNPAAIAAAVAGIVRAGGTFARWGVGTWGNGEGGGPNQPPAQADCEQLQSGNTSGPYPGTDLNWLYADLSVFAPYGLVLPAPKPKLPEESDMVVVHGPQQTLAGNRRSILFQGGVPMHSWYGPSAMGKVKEAADYAASVVPPIPEFTIHSDDPADEVFAAMVALADHPAAPGGVVNNVVVDEDAIATKVADKLAARLAG